jgi:hypothetical protein
MILRALALRFRSQGMREWPRYREGAIQDERRWIDSLDDRELADLAAGLGAVDRAVKAHRRGKVFTDWKIPGDEDAA